MSDLRKSGFYAVSLTKEVTAKEVKAWSLRMDGKGLARRGVRACVL